MEEQKKSEGTLNNSDRDPVEGEDVEQVQAKIVEESSQGFEDGNLGETIEEIEQDLDKTATVKNLISLVIILAGVAVGSLFIDIVQFVSGSGYSERALKNSDVFVAGEKTWVSFEDPAVNISVLTVGDDELGDCKDCDPTEVLVWLKRFVPTLVSKKVVAETPEGEELIKKFGIKTIPAYIFSSSVEKTEFYQGEAKALFEEKENSYVLNSAGLGIPVGKYLEVPSIGDSDSVLGSKEAPVKIFVFSDFQCPFCSKFYQEIRNIVKEYGEEKVALVYKDLPLDFHPQAMNAANAVRCAQDQGKFWEMADLLYSKQDVWGETEGVASFKNFAVTLQLDGAKFNTCIDQQQFLGAIEKDIAEAGNFGISGTPATFINDQFVNGVVQADELKKIIDKQLEE